MPETSGQGRFAVVLDEHNQLMTFALDHQSSLCLILRGSKGHNELVNLSQKFGFSSKQTIRTLAASQNVDGTVHLVFALQQDGQADQLYVLRPMTPRVTDWTSLSGTAAFYTGPQWDINIQEILLGSSNDGSGPTKTHPQLYLVIKQRTLVTEDIWILTVNSDNKSWSKPSLFKLSVTTDQILSKCVANLSMYRGMYVLYKENPSKVSMRFVGLDPEEPHSVLQSIDQVVPEGTTQIASFENADGLSDLLIAGKQLSWLSAGDGIQGRKKPIPIDTSNAYEGCTQLQPTNPTMGAMTVRSVALAQPTSQDFVISSSGAPTKQSEALPIPGQDKTSDSFAVVVSRPGPGQIITNTFVSQRTVIFMFEELEALAHAPEIAAAREKYINHFEKMLSFYGQLDTQLATFETASQAANTKLTSVYDKLDSHLKDIKIAKTVGDGVAIIGTILCFTPAAAIGAGLLAVGTATSVGADAMGTYLFEPDASKEFGETMETYNSASKAVGDTFKNIETTKEDMADSLAELITMLRTWPMPRSPPGGQTQMSVPGKPDLDLPRFQQRQPHAPNIFSEVAFRGLSLGPAGWKSLEGILAKNGGKAVSKVTPFLGKAVPFLGIVVNVLDIVETWTTSNETLVRANKLRNDVNTSTTTLRDAMKALKSSLESQLGSPTALENLRKLLRIRKNPPRGGPPPPPLTPKEVCKITGLMKSMIDTTFLVFAQLSSRKSDDDTNKDPAEQYWAEFVPEPAVLQLSQSAFTAPVVDSVYDIYQQPSPKTDDKDKNEKPTEGGYVAPVWFFAECKMVKFGNKRIYNATGTSHDHRATSWIQFWNWFSAWRAKAVCIGDCRISNIGGFVSPDVHDYQSLSHSVGGHMEKVNFNGRYYILPICAKHNAPGGFYDRLNGRWMLTVHDAYAVKIWPAA